MKNLTENQLVQEEEYAFPYHFADFISDKHKCFKFIEPLDLVRIVKEKIKSLDSKIILDAGCGDGRLCYELKSDNYKVVGVDYSERAISFARGFNPELEFFVQDLKNLNIPYKFDAIVLMEVLEHFIPSDIDAILLSLSKVLNDNGKLIITVPSDNMELTDKHYQHFNKASLEATIKPYFKIEELTGYSKRGSKRKRYKFLRSMGTLFFVFRRSSSWARNYINYIKKYYQNSVSVGTPEECNGLFAVCVKSEKD
ncbi:MAG: class I SAM-dependent methyltransferase [Bacteroidales bacterium]|nr:class I SAM-dependent methyltransferase [Bacteroidales bacterium]